MATLDKMISNIMALSVYESRYGGGYIAALEWQDEQHLADVATGGDQDYADSQLALSCSSWYPIAEGDTVAEAIAALTKKIEPIRDFQIPAIGWAVNKVSQILDGPISQYRQIPEKIVSKSLIDIVDCYNGTGEL